MRGSMKALTIAILGYGTGPALAEPLSVQLGYEAEASNNITRQEDGEEEDIEHRPYLDLGYGLEGTRVDLATAYRLEGRIYQEGTFDNDDVVSGASSIRVELLPERLSWTAKHSRTESLSNSRAPDTEANRQLRKRVATHALLNFLGNGPNALVLRTGAERYSADRAVDDSLRYDASLRLTRQLSQVRSVGISAAWLQVEPDTSLLRDYTRTNLRLHGEQGTRTLTGAVSAGYNQIERDGGDGQGGYAFSADLTWNPDEGAQRWMLSASHELTDRINNRRIGVRRFGELREELTNNGLVFEDTRGRLSYALDGIRWGFGVSVGASEEDFEDAPRDERTYTASVDIRRNLQRNLALKLSVVGQRREFEQRAFEGPLVDLLFEARPELRARFDEDREYDEVFADLRLEWEPGPRTTFYAGAGWNERWGAEGLEDYDEATLTLGVSRDLR